MMHCSCFDKVTASLLIMANNGLLAVSTYVMGMLEDFGAWMKVPSCPQSAVCLRMVVVLASLIQGLMNAGGEPPS